MTRMGARWPSVLGQRFLNWGPLEMGHRDTGNEMNGKLYHGSH